MAQLSKLKIYLQLFVPSSIGVVFYVFLSAYAIVLNHYDKIKQFLRFPDNVNVFHQIADWADIFLNTILGQTRTNVVVVAAFWALVGLGVYLFLRGIARYISELDDDIEVRRYIWPKGADRTRPLKVTVERTVFRILALIVLIVVLAGPVAKVLKGPVFVDLAGSNVIVQYIVWFISSMLIWHVVVILLRLVLLRVRVMSDGRL